MFSHQRSWWKHLQLIAVRALEVDFEHQALQEASVPEAGSNPHAA